MIHGFEKYNSYNDLTKKALTHTIPFTSTSIINNISTSDVHHYLGQNYTDKDY